MSGMRPGAPRPQVVAIGGGHGLARALQALRRLDAATTAVVTVADDGGSSGRLRRELDIIAPGDLRMALLTLAGNRRLAAVLEHRFTRGQLSGHALGNLLLVALAEQADGDFLAALDAAAQLLDCAGRVWPSTTESVQLKAQVAGDQVEGQVQVATADGRIERIWLEPTAPSACRQALEAIGTADVVMLGPGSLFTSVIANLLVPGIAAAVASGPAPVVYVANILTQPGETRGLDAGGHVGALLGQVPGLVVDAVILHDGPTGVGGGDSLGTDLGECEVPLVVRADVAARGADGHVTSGHDPQRLAEAMTTLFGRLSRH